MKTMEENSVRHYLNLVLVNMPNDWLNLTTHRLDIYDESLAKTQFLEQFEGLFKTNTSSADALNALPTAYDYIRLGHPLSCVLEWGIARLHRMKPEHVISFSSATMPLMAILRTNLLAHKNTRIAYSGMLPASFDETALKEVYGYRFELMQVRGVQDLSSFDGSTVFITEKSIVGQFELNNSIDFHIHVHGSLGSVLLINEHGNEHYTSAIQHVRRRETIAMTPANCIPALESLVNQSAIDIPHSDVASNKASVMRSIQTITRSTTKALVGSSGLSIQYAIMMGLIDHAQKHHQGKAIKFIVPPNCYGGTNDQAKRVAASIANVEVVDLPVDGDNDMVNSVETVLAKIAQEDGVPYIIAEIPTNPRLEVPDLDKLRDALVKKRKTDGGETAIDPVFILDQTFCPNVHFVGEGDILSSLRTISYVSGSKFPSGGKCTAGYCVGNNQSVHLMEAIEKHLLLCDNEATALQYEILAKQLPSMNQRINDAYKNTRSFVNFIKETLPGAKINFVSEERAAQSFTPSVFSLDLPTKGNNDDEREAYKRALNLKLIDTMIKEIPDESKYCVSYGQLKGCYWTIPATSTQGTTKEGDKDYIARVALSANMDLERHKEVFMDFVREL
jgi:cystathionine beta-lyase/cystathionine gamma-synthase